MEIFQDMENFQDIDGLLQKRVEIHVEIQDMETFQDRDAKNCTLLHRTTIGGRKQIYHHEYNLYACGL